MPKRPPPPKAHRAASGHEPNPDSPRAIRVQTQLSAGRYLLVCLPNGRHFATRVEGDTAYPNYSLWGLGALFTRLEANRNAEAQSGESA